MNYYDYDRGWEQTNPGWYEIILHRDDPRISVTTMEDCICWITANIGKWQKHCRWCYGGNDLYFKFRYERDYLWFKLRWM